MDYVVGPWLRTVDPMESTIPPISELVLVSRLVSIPADHLGPVLGSIDLAVDLGDAGSLVLTEPFALAPGGLPTWRTRGRLHARAGLVRSTRVEVAVTTWSGRASQLWVVPTSTSPHRWGRRRLRRYFELAHLAADALEHRLRQLGRAVAEPHEDLATAA